MYAIRSYYGIKIMKVPFDLKGYKYLTDDTKDIDYETLFLKTVHRITSYNVCYTKLLRLK